LGGAGFLWSTLMTLRSELEPFATSGREAFSLVDDLFTDIVVALRRDCRFTDICLSELELLLADARANTERRLFEKLRDRVHLDDVDYVGDGQ
jgi:hypothetical protein